VSITKDTKKRKFIDGGWVLSPIGTFGEGRMIIMDVGIENSTIVELKDVACKAGNRYLLRDVTWNIKQGDHWVVFGMNGSGKTTLLSIIAGFKHFTNGEVKVFGENFNDENILEIRKKIGWVSASFFDKYYSKESALNIVLSGRNGTLGLDDAITLADVKLAKSLLCELKLGDKVNRTFDMFSKGERQNILIARALISNPDILILDEPCNGLDVYNRNYLFKTIEELSKKKELTIIYVTHYVEEILPLFKNILMLKNGYIFRSGKINEIMCEESVSELLGYKVELNQESNGAYRLKVETESKIIELLK